MAKQTDIAGQQYAWETTSDVSKAMIGAGTSGSSRIAAGVKAAWRAKTSSMYSKADTTTVSRVLRLFGKDSTAKWIDRFFAKEKQTQERTTKTPTGDVADTTILAAVKTNTGLLKAQGMRLNAMHGLLDMVVGDVNAIKSMIMPKTVDIRGTSGKDRKVQFNPLAPPGEQFLEITKSGVLTYKKLSGKDKETAGRRAAYETAAIVLKVIKEDQAKAELRKKFAFKEDDEQYKVKDDPLKEVTKKIDHMSEALDEIKRRTGFFSVLRGVFSMILRFLAPAGLVALAGSIGYAVGSWLSEKFKLSERIGDAVNFVLSKFGLGEDEKLLKSYDDAKNARIANDNLKLIGTDWKAVDLGTYERSDGTVFKGKDLPPETKELFRRRDIRAFGDDTPEALKTPKAFDSETPVVRGGPMTRGGLRRKQKGDKYSELADMVARGEGTSDERAMKKGYASGYDTTVYYGKYGNTWNGKPVSQLNLAEVGLLQRDMLEKQKKLGYGPGERSSALGKYQFTYTTLFGEGGKPGLIEQLGLKKTEKFDGPMQERLFRVLVKEAEARNTKNGVLDTKGFQYDLAGRWASLADPNTDKGRYGGQNAPIKTAELQPVLTTLGKGIDQASRDQAIANSPANVTVVAPQQNIVAPTVKNPAPPRPVQKATPLTEDPSFIRSMGRDVVHPTAVY